MCANCYTIEYGVLKIAVSSTSGLSKQETKVVALLDKYPARTKVKLDNLISVTYDISHDGINHKLLKFQPTCRAILPTLTKN